MNEGHCSAGQLVAVMDGESTEAWAADHLASCSECRRTIAELSEAAEALRLSMAAPMSEPSVDEYDADFLRAIGAEAESAPSPRSVGRRIWVRRLAVAAGIGTLLIAPPVRAWVLQTIDGLREPAVDTSDPSPVGQPDLGAVSIRVSGSVLRVELTGTPSSIVLTAAPSGSIATSLRVGAPAGITALPNGFQVSDADDRDVRLEVPESVLALQLIVDGIVRWDGPVPRPLGEGRSLPTR